MEFIREGTSFFHEIPGIRRSRDSLARPSAAWNQEALQIVGDCLRIIAAVFPFSSSTRKRANCEDRKGGERSTLTVIGRRDRSIAARISGARDYASSEDVFLSLVKYPNPTSPKESAIVFVRIGGIDLSSALSSTM